MNFASFAFVLLALWIIYSVSNFLIHMRKEEKRFLDYFKEKRVLYSLSSFILSGFVLFLFYMPQDAMAENYRFDQISIEKITLYETIGRIEISDKGDLEEFSNIFRGYTCRRVINSSYQASLDSDSIFIDLVVHDPQKNRAHPLHFVVTEDNLIRYSAGNTSFFYKIKDTEHKLENEILDYVNRHLKIKK